MTRMGWVRALQILAGVLLGLVAALSLLRPGRSPGSGEGGGSHFLASPVPAPAFALTSHHGKPVTSGDFPGKVLAVFFGYTSCPDVCPLTLSNLSRAFGEMGETGERIQVLLISVDPHRDTRERLKQYLELFHPSFLGLTGTEEEIRAVADRFGAHFARQGTGEDYTVDHTARTFVIDRLGQIPLTFPVTATPGEMARDLSRILEDRS